MNCSALGRIIIGFIANAVLLTTALSALTVPLLVLIMNRMG
jgi:TM2 domain-containing membrane protein YozV